MDWHNSITVDPAVLTGKPIVKGTRIAVEFVLDHLVQGWPETEIACQYRLNFEQVRACVAYAQA